MSYSAQELEMQKTISYYEIDAKINSFDDFDEYGNPTDWFDLKDVTTEEILKKHKIDSSKMNLDAIKKLKKIFK